MPLASPRWIRSFSVRVGNTFPHFWRFLCWTGIGAACDCIRFAGGYVQEYIGALTIVVLLGMVLVRVFVLRRRGIKTVKFGEIDKKDFLIPPFAFFYFYVVFAAAFHFPGVSRQEFFRSALVSWVGVLFCIAGLSVLFISLISFGKSFRIGIDPDEPDKLVTTGIFGLSRNPIYVAFGLVLLGEFLVFPELDSSRLSSCRRLAHSPSGAARRRVSASALRSLIFRVLPASAALRVNMNRNIEART